MDVQTKTDLIHNVVSDKKITCPNCGTMNNSDAGFCVSCGVALRITKVVSNLYGDTKSIFAEGLPDWDIEPPQVMVRRKRCI